MLNYDLICLFVGLNVLTYLILHIILEIKYRKKDFDNLNISNKPKPWNNHIDQIFTVLPSIYLWLLFLLIPFTVFIEDHPFYSLLFVKLQNPVSELVQTIGLIFIFMGTLVAILGRIARGIYAISWGLPNKIIKYGIFKYIRHPLYSSYIFYFIGLQLAFVSFIMIPLLFGIIGYYLSSLYEETILLENFGDEYKNYMKQTKRFIPWIW